MRKAVCGALFALMATITVSARSTELEDVIENTLRQSVVKIDVSAQNSVFENQNDICKSEGTGFLIGPRHVVTAAHVHLLSDKCGSPIVIVKSKVHELQKLATIRASKEDVTILEVSTPFPTELCSLTFKADVFGTKAIRFGIPGGLSEPPAAIPVNIGQRVGEFYPMVVMVPTTSEPGESGGPIIHLFNAVGITHARHARYPSLSFMTLGSVVRALMTENSIDTSGHLCNPAEASASIVTPPPEQKPAVPGSFIIKIQPREALRGEAGEAVNRILLSIAQEFAAGSVSIRSADEKSVVALNRTIGSLYDAQQIVVEIPEATARVSNEIERALWDIYVRDGTKTGKWSSINPPLVPIIRPASPPFPTPQRLRPPCGFPFGTSC